MARKNAVDWSQHFELIRQVCPWSWSAWQQGQILIRPWHQGFRHLDTFKAIIYITKRKPRQTKKFARELSSLYPEYEFLVSDRTYGLLGTPVPVIIQQDSRTLQYLRDKMGV